MNDCGLKAVTKPSVDSNSFNPEAQIPYGLDSRVVGEAIRDLYDILHLINSNLVKRSYPMIEELMLGNAFSGFLGEILVKQVGARSKTLARNMKVGGHPDLIPRSKYPNDSVLRGDEGIEVKMSRHRGGWQGHNPEKSWLMVFIYSVGQGNSPTEILAVLAAHLTRRDWSFSGRSETSRRTITASVTKAGMDKLRANWIYRKA